MAKNPDGSTRLNPDGSIYITPVPSVQIDVPGWKGVGVFGNTKGMTVNGKPIELNYTSPSHGKGYITNYNPAPPPPPTTTTPSNSGGGSSSSNAHPMSAEFIKDTYDPELGYERYDSPGDNPYISNYTPPQFGYMNDLSTLSPDELDYREGNIRGLDDRQNSIENPGALLNNYIFSIKEKLNKTPKTKIDIIGKDQEVDNYQDRIFTSREGYESERDKESPYDKYDSSKYY